MSEKNISLLQLVHPKEGRKVCKVREPHLIVLEEVTSVFGLVMESFYKKENLSSLISKKLSSKSLEYDLIYNGLSKWKILPAIDHPEEPMHCLVSGTGLTHKNSAMNRQLMHQTNKESITDSMKMYQWGVEGGKAENNVIGTQPEWFYKGNGTVLKSHNDYLTVPSYADEGGEEAEVAGLYITDAEGNPWRIGFSPGNEFSDHLMERKNYLYLAHSKIRQCSIGPELAIGHSFNEISGTVNIFRKGEMIWCKQIQTGEINMAHNLSNIEHHLFKHACHRIPFQVHVHFFGADALSFGDQIRMEEDDIVKIEWQGLGRPLSNKLKITKKNETLIKTKQVH